MTTKTKLYLDETADSDIYFSADRTIKLSRTPAVFSYGQWILTKNGEILGRGTYHDLAKEFDCVIQY